MHIWKQNCGPVSQIKRSSTWENKMGFPKNQVLPLTHHSAPSGGASFGFPGDLVVGCCSVEEVRQFHDLNHRVGHIWTSKSRVNHGLVLRKAFN